MTVVRPMPAGPKRSCRVSTPFLFGPGFARQSAALALVLCSAATSSGAATGSMDVEAGLWEKTWSAASDIWDSPWGLFDVPDGTEFARLWDDMLPRLEHALTLRERHDELPERSWFGDDKDANQSEIDQLLDQSIAILSASPATRYRERMRGLEADIRENKAAIATLRDRRVSAPRDSLWQSTVQEIDEEMAARSRRIRSDQAELEELVRAFSAELRNIGLEISEDRLRFLLSTVVGDDMVNMGYAFDNVKTLTLQLEQLMVDSEEDFQSAKRYYGMFTVLLRVLDRMHRQLLDALDDHYLPRIDGIIARTDSLLTETQSLLRTTSTGHDLLRANINAQTLTRQAALRYRAFLREQRASVAEARRRLGNDISVADNTYDTVKVSGELVGLMRAGQELLDSLLSLDVPTLRPFENLDMQREFERLTARLKEGKV